MQISPRSLLITGFVLVVIGVILPMLMVLQIIQSTLPLNFVSFLSSVIGLFLGLIGAAMYVRKSRR